LGVSFPKREENRTVTLRSQKTVARNHFFLASLFILGDATSVQFVAHVA